VLLPRCEVVLITVRSRERKETPQHIRRVITIFRNCRPIMAAVVWPVNANNCRLRDRPYGLLAATARFPNDVAVLGGLADHAPKRSVSQEQQRI
jgi:hypothetical protein